MTVPQTTETIVSGLKIVSAIEHLKNNRIEYLVLLLLSHMMGITALVATKAAGVCA